MRRTLVTLLVLGLLAVAAVPASAARGGVPGSPIIADAIWADGEAYGTILQKPLHYNGNDRSFDRLYLVPDQNPVAEAAPGNNAYNGGRWLPTPVDWNTEPYLITSAADLMAAAATGDVTIGEPMIDAAFLCPLIPNH